MHLVMCKMLYLVIVMDQTCVYSRSACLNSVIFNCLYISKRTVCVVNRWWLGLVFLFMRIVCVRVRMCVRVCVCIPESVKI